MQMSKYALKMLPHIVISQYVYETESWNRLLAYYIQENISFKNRLSEIIEVKDDKKTLETAEKFHDEFISQDRMISYLSNELQSQAKLLEHSKDSNGLNLKEIIKNHEKLSSDIKKAERLFALLKEEFGQYQSHVL